MTIAIVIIIAIVIMTIIIIAIVILMAIDNICPTLFANGLIRSVFKMSCLFLRPRLWQFEIRDSADA